MKWKDITSFCCRQCNTWVDGRKCPKCKRSVQPSNLCKHESRNGNFSSTIYDCYRPPRPKSMTPVAYYNKYKCVDANFTRKTNGRYYCNPAHCNKSWISKKERDKHLDMAYSILY